MSKGCDGNSSYPERYLRQICKPFVERIVQNAGRQKATTKKRIISAIENDLGKLVTIFGEIPATKDKDTPHLISSLPDNIWGTLKDLFTKFNQVDTIIIKLCQVVQMCIEALGVNFLPYAHEYVEIIETGFLVLPQPEFLFALETSVSTLGNVPKMVEPFTKTYEKVSEKALRLLNSENSQNEILPSVILSSKTLEKSLQLVETTIRKNQELNIQKALCQFLNYLFRLPHKKPRKHEKKTATEILINNYEGIYIKLFILKLMEYSSQEQKSWICGVIFVSFMRMKEQTIGWIHEAFQQDPKEVLSESQKEDMLKNLIKIDFSNLKGSTVAQYRELTKILENFNRTFEIFDCEED